MARKSYSIFRKAPVLDPRQQKQFNAGVSLEFFFRFAEVQSELDWKGILVKTSVCKIILKF